jgi:HlyD family secretion protein
VRELERAQGSARAADAKAQTEVDVAQATADLERQKLTRIAKQLQFCEIHAPAEGSIVYAKDKNKAVELGGVAHFKQKLFSIPSSTHMKVDAFVHESVVKKVQPGMKAKVRIDAFPSLELQGTIQDVATHYDSTRQWLSGGVKDYATTITLDETPGVALRTGMTAQVQILVDQRSQALVVPLTSVAERSGSHYCFVIAGNDVAVRPVSVGASTEDLVEILDGLDEGERVALDAGFRARSELALPRPQGGPSPVSGTPRVADSR